MNNKEVRQSLQKTIDSLELRELRNQSTIAEWGEQALGRMDYEQLRTDNKELRTLEYKGYELMGIIPNNEKKVQIWLHACISVYQLQVLPMMFK